MALNFPKLPGLGSSTDAKSRIFFVLAGVVVVGVLIYAAFVIFGGGGAETTGPSRVANPAAGLQSVPGSKLSPQYYQALRQANVQATQQATVTGGSAVPTLINVGQPPAMATGNCTVLCNEDNVDVANDINDLVKQGKLSQEEADKLTALAKGNVPVAEYAAALDELVRQGKLTPEQARKLLETYKKQHASAMLAESANSMDALIKSGQLPVSVANDLLAFQKTHPTPAEYAAELARLVKEGKISPATAAMLLAQYTQQQQKEIAKQGAFALRQMATAGEVTADVAKGLADLQSKNIPVDQYAAELDRLVKEGKLTPAAAAKLLEQYKKQRLGVATAGSLGQLLSQGGAKAEEAKRLLALQGNNASLNDYAEELKRAVVAGVLTPEQAAQLLQEYRAAIVPVAGVAPGPETNLPGAADFAKLQQQLQQQAVAAPVTTAPPTAEFAAAEAAAKAAALQARQQRIQDMEAAMSAQAQQLVGVWQTIPPMQHVAGTVTTKTVSTTTTTTGAGSADGGPTGKPGAATGRPLIKAGSILFAVLETTVDSDYPDTPVMATIVSGDYKGAKLMGKVASGVGPNQDKVSLTFTTMGMDAWPTNKPITAFAIDPDTAKTVFASSVDSHYLKRYGAIMATSFLSGYASAIQSSGATATTGIFGTSSVNPQLSPASKLAVGIGQIGTNLNSIVAKNVDTPITIKVNSGVGLGILFMSDVTQ